MLRRILGLCVGLMVAVGIVAAGEWIGHALYPPPPDGVNLQDRAALEAYIKSLPAGAIAAVLVSWAAGAFGGGAVAAFVTQRRSAAWAIGGAMLLAGIAQMIAIPHPLWFMVMSVPATLLPAWLAGRLFAKPI